MTNTLKPCPFCGHSILTTDQERDEWHVTCGHCHARGPISYGYDLCRESWNKLGNMAHPVPPETLKKLFGSFPDLPERDDK